MVTDQAGIPVTILPASQVVRLLVPAYVQEDPSLAGVLSESMADRIADKLGGKTVAEVLPKPPPDMATVKSDDTIIEVAAIHSRVRHRCRRIARAIRLSSRRFLPTEEDCARMKRFFRRSFSCSPCSGW